MSAVDIQTARLFTRLDARKISEPGVKALAGSIAEIGVINPLRVRSAQRFVNGALSDAWEVTAGAHRLAAAMQVGLETVPCIVVADDDLHAELVMIDENLMRAELSGADRARQTARRKEIYLALYPQTAAGVAGAHAANREMGNASANFAPAFTADAAEKLGKSERFVQLYAERGEKIADDVLGRVSGTALDTGVYLDKLKKLSHEDQRAKVEADLAAPKPVVRDFSEKQTTDRNKLDGDVKARAAREVASMLLERIPGDCWDALKANLYAAGATNIANEMGNITGESIMDRRFAS